MAQGLARLENQSHGIVCACDLPRLDDVRKLIEAIDPVDGLVGYKLGSLLTLRYGLVEVVRQLRNVTGKALIYDHQKAGLDIPSMAAHYAAVCRDAGVDALVIFPLAGPTAVDAFVGEPLKLGVAPIVGGALPLPDYKVSGGGYVSASALDRIAERAITLGARDFIVPATDAPAIRRHARLFGSRDGTRLFLPGIGALGGEIKKAFAMAKGLSAYAIIGRAIYATAAPAEAARRFADEALAFAR